MLASDYIRASIPAQAMTKWCKEHGFPFAVQPPGSKGHPFLIVNANGGRVKVPFSMTPSDKRHAGNNAVRSLKRALFENGLWPLKADDLRDYEKEEAEASAPPPVHTTSDGCPLPPATLRRKRDGSLAGGYQGPEASEYFRVRKEWIASRLLSGASYEDIAASINETGLTFRAASIAPITTELRYAGLIPEDWRYTPPAKAEPTVEQKPEPEAKPVVEVAPKLPAQLNGAFADLVYMALKDARTKSAKEADDLATTWIEKIADGRKRAELDVIAGEVEGRYLRVLDALTQ